jgi:hypothetical protein
MAEMVLLAPVMITMWIGIDYFRAGYARRLDALAKAQGAAWKLASSNDGSCFGNQEAFAGFTGGNDPTDPAIVGDKGADGVSSFKGNTSSSIFKYAHARVDATEKTKAAHFDSDSVGEVKGGMFITCNEVVPSTSGGGAAQFADQDVLTPVIDWVKSLF